MDGAVALHHVPPLNSMEIFFHRLVALVNAGLEVGLDDFGVGVVEQLSMELQKFEHGLVTFDLEGLAHQTVNQALRQNVSVAQKVNVSVFHGVKVILVLDPLGHGTEVRLWQVDVARDVGGTAAHQLIEIGLQRKLVDFVHVFFVMGRHGASKTALRKSHKRAGHFLHL